MKRLLAMILAVTLICFSFAGCGDDKTSDGVSGGEKVSSDKKEKPKVTLEETTDLTLYINQYTKGSMDYAITKYKEAYPDVNVNIVDYSAMDVWEFGTKISGEIQSGKGPDVVFVDFLVENLYKSAMSGAFYDVNEVMEGDEEFNLADYNKAAMDAGVIDGKRYLVPMAIYIPFVMTTQSIVDELGIDISKCDNVIGLGEEINRILKEKPTQRIFKERSQIHPLFGMLGLDTVDYVEGEITVDEDLVKEFGDIFKVLNEQDANISDMAYMHTIDAYNNLSTKAEAFELRQSRDISDTFINMSALNGKGEVPILFPVKTDDGKIQANVNLGAAITSNSPNKLNAYNFIKILLSEELQQFSHYPMGMPVRTASIDVQIADNQEGIKANENTFLEQHGFTMKMPEQGVVDEFAKQIKSVEHCTWDTIADGYVYSALISYMKGDKEFEKAMEEMKSQLEIYVTE